MKKFRSALGTFVVMGLLGCSSNPARNEAQGKLSVALVGVASDGTAYRLRSAEFQIFGYPQVFDTGGSTPAPGGSGASGAGNSAGGGFALAGSGGASVNAGVFSEIVSSETNPDEPVISRRLVPGSYYVNLLGDSWFIEKVTPAGPERVASSVLLSPRSQFAYVWNGGTSDVAYRFGVNGEPIDFRSGELNIQVQIELPGEGLGSGGGFGFGGAPGAGAGFGGL